MRVYESGFIRRSVHAALLTSIFFFARGLASTLHAATVIPVEYLESTGYQYVETGVNITYGHKLTCRWSQASDSSVTTFDIGWGTGNANTSLAGGGRQSSGTVYAFLYGGDRGFSPGLLKANLVVGDQYEDVVTVTNKTTFTMIHLADSVTRTYTMSTPNTTSFNSGNSLHLFASHHSNSYYQSCGVKRIYRVIYETVTGTVVFDLFPVTVDGVPAFYDRISKNYLYNGANPSPPLIAGPATTSFRILDSGDVQFAAMVSVSAAGGGTVSLTNATRAVGANRPVYFVRGATGDFVYTATPDAGCVFSCWTGDTYGLSSAQLTNAVLSLTGSVPRVLVANFATPIAADQIPTSCYVQDGLTNQWDAIENAGEGVHDANAYIWKDLKGPLDLTLTSKGAWSDDGKSLIVRSGCAARGAAATSPYSTIEAVYKMAGHCYCLFSSGCSTGGPCRWLRCYPITTYIDYRFYADTVSHPTPFVLQMVEPTVIKSFAAVYSGNVVSNIFENGSFIPAPEKAQYSDSVQEYKVCIGARSLNDTSYFWNGEVHTIRLYNRALSEDEVLHNAIVDRCRFASADNVRCTKSNSSTYAFSCRVDYEPNETSRGSIACAVNGETQTAGSSVWADEGATLTFTPSAASGYKFNRWEGETNGLTVAANGVATCKSFPRMLVAQFVKTSSTGTARTLSMANSTKVWEWSDPATWTPNGVPEADDSVTISGYGTVLLREPTPALASLTLKGYNSSNYAKILCTNWTTKVNADKITVRAYGQFTTPATKLNENMSNRVWIACRDLDVQKDGQINVDEKGYIKNNGRGWDGVMTPTATSGGAYGGLGSGGEGTTLAHCYGSLTEPEDLGSGGYGGTGCYGGGAVKIEASNNVTINGNVTAKGRCTSIWAYGGSSGGSIFISTRTIDGSGTVSVEVPDNWGDWGHANGGGGRISVRYNSSAQKAKESTCLVDFRAKSGPGSYTRVNPYQNIVTTNGLINPIAWACSCGYPGTLYFTDNQMLTNRTRLANGVKLSGVFHSGDPLPDPLVLPGPVSFENSYLNLGMPLSELVIDGDLSCKGTYFLYAGLALTNTNLRVKGNVVLQAGHLSMENNCTHIDGDFSMKMGSTGSTCRSGRLTVQAGETNGVDRAYGVEFYVGGKWTMEKYAVVYPYAHPTCGSIPYFECQNLDFQPEAWFDAREAGYNSGTGPGSKNVPGSGIVSGASHGGLGGADQESYRAATYGDAEKPVTPGSGGYNRSGSNIRGGGAIRLHARNRIDMNGYMTAVGYPLDGSWYHRGSSGGSIYLSCARYASTNGILTVRGGEGSIWGGSPAGGGRIAIWSRAYLSTNMEVYVNRGMNGTGNTKFPSEDGTFYIYKNTGAMFLIR